jgi:DNA uptake protein ComE-like DNA-binding protein
MDKFTEEQKEAMRQGAKEVLEDVKGVAKKAAETAKPVTKRVKKVAADAAETAKPVTDAAKKVAVEAAKKVPMKPEVYVQFGGKEILTADLVQDAKTAYKAAGNRAAVRTLRIYVKPEDSAAYFVINDEFNGKIDL